MSRYYLMSQLPSLDGVSDAAPLPITEERFLELCRRFLGKREVEQLDALTLVPSRDGEKVGSALVDAWNEGERQLRLALAAARAAKMAKPFDEGREPLPVAAVQTAQAALELDDPMEAERFLSRCRLERLEALRPMDAFCEEAVLYYGLKLKLLARLRRFDGAQGEAAYRTIYASIMDGDGQEAVS